MCTWVGLWAEVMGRPQHNGACLFLFVLKWVLFDFVYKNLGKSRNREKIWVCLVNRVECRKNMRCHVGIFFTCFKNMSFIY